MAAGDMNIHFSNGQKLSCYWAGSDVISSAVPVSMTAEAASTNPKQFAVVSACNIVDITCVTGNTTGLVEVYANGKPTGFQIPCDKRWVNVGATNQPGRERYVPRGFSFKPGVIYSLINKIVQT